MKIDERIDINCPISRVWPFVITPELFQKWNEKVTSMEARGKFMLGQTFITHYLWKGKDVQVTSTVTKLEENRHLELHHANPLGEGGPTDMECIETVTLTEKGNKTVVHKIVDMKNLGMPLWLAPLVWFVAKFGKPTEPSKLKELCEGSNT